MCEPATLGIILSAGSSLAQGFSAQSAANANAKAALVNAERARAQAYAVEEKKARELTALHQQRRQVMGEQRVAGAANGLNMQSGSGLNLLQSTAVEAKKDEDNLLWNAELERWGYSAQAIESENQASQFRAQETNAMISGIISAATSVAGGMADKAGAASGGMTSADVGLPNGIRSGLGGFSSVSSKWSKGLLPFGGLK